jgi:PGF-pre-PGF domain-containing protein
MKIKKILIEIAICLVVLTTIGAAETVILTFDDGWKYTAQNALPILNSNGQSGVVFLITDPLYRGYSDYMTLADLNSLSIAGWDISSHTISHPVLTNLTSQPEKLKTELVGSEQWLVSNGFGRGSMFLSYPEGAYNTAVQTEVTKYYTAARCAGELCTGTNTNPPTASEMYQLRTIEVDCSDPTSGNCTSAGVINQISNVLNQSGLLIITFHKIVLTLSTGNDPFGNALSSTEFRKDDLQNISNYLKNNNITVSTLSQVFGTSTPVYSPPSTPAGLTILSGSNWINLSWVPGAGTPTTTGYNVVINGVTIFTNTTNTSYNFSAVFGTNYHVQIYGVNGFSVNLVPADINATIQQFIPPTPTNIIFTIDEKNYSIRFEWAAGVGENVTDFFNYSMNGGNWTNLTKNTSVNITAKPGISYMVNVYAVNATNSITTNQTPAAISAIIPLYMPPIPEEVRQTSGNFWAYFEWEDNRTADNVTDLYSYNVDGNWTNLTTNKSVNVTTVPHGIVNISVYAFNSSNGGIQNPIPLVMSLQIQNNQIELNNIWAEYDIYVGDALRINPTAYNPDNDTLTFTTNATNASINLTTGAFILNTSNGDQGTYQWNITGYDGYSSHTIDFMVVITTKPVHTSPTTNNGGGNRGGGGGTDVFDPNTKFYERHDSQIRNDVESTLGFSKNELVSNVTFQGVRNYGVVTVKVSILKDNPKPQYLSNVYKFFSINLDNIKQNSEYLYIKNSTVTVLLNKSDINGNTVKAYRYANDSWVNIEIEDTHIENAEIKQFELKSDGLSNFAITLEPKEPILTLSSIGENEVDQTENQTAVDKVVNKAVEAISKSPESLYRTIINLIKKYMWWI